jgi:hypothetical protein
METAPAWGQNAGPVIPMRHATGRGAYINVGSQCPFLARRWNTLDGLGAEPRAGAIFITGRSPRIRRRRLRIVFFEPGFRGVRGGEDLDVLGVANLLAGVDVD